MASLTRKTTSPYWIACFTDHTGRQRQRSTKETDRKKALKLAEDFEEAFRGKPNEAQARKVLSEIYREVTGEKLNLESSREYLDNWIKRKTPETKPGTLARYKIAVRKFLEFLGPRAERDLTFISSRDVLAFRDETARKLSPSSANTDIKILRIAFGQAWKDGLIPVNAAAQVSLLKVQRDANDRRRMFTKDELECLFRVLDGEWLGIATFGLYLGKRLGDIVRLKWHQINFDQGEIRFVTGKTGRIVIDPITEPVREYLDSLPRNVSADAAVFPNAYALVQKSNGDTRRLSGQFYDLLVKASILPKRTKKATGKGRSARRKINPVSFHSFRHTTTSWLKGGGVAGPLVMDIIGHDSEQISWNYTHFSIAEKRAALERLPKVRVHS